MINKDGQETLFCYRCCKHIVPIIKQGESEYYTDYDHLPIVGELPHCEYCGHEVFSPQYNNQVNELKGLLRGKYHVKKRTSY